MLVALYPGLREADPDWKGAAASLPEGSWRDLFSGQEIGGGEDMPLARLFELLPAAVLVRR